MRRRLGVTLVMLLVLSTGSVCLWAQMTRRDAVTLQSGQRVTGRVLKESWKGVELDQDLNGVVDETYKLSEVQNVNYGDKPKYLEEAAQLRDKPDKVKEYINTLKRAHFDQNTSKWLLQHAYYDLAKEYEKLALTDEEYISKVLEAYEKLLEDIPDSRYALQLRGDLGELFLARGDMARARKNYQALIGGGFGDVVENRARFRMAATYLLEGKADGVAELVEPLKNKELGKVDQAKLKVIQAEVLMAQGRYADAHGLLVKTLGEGGPKSSEPAIYLALGDVLSRTGGNEAALLAYLRVHLMYQDVEGLTQARALLGATRMCRRLNRKDDARAFREELLKRFPGPFWEGRLQQ